VASEVRKVMDKVVKDGMIRAVGAVISTRLNKGRKQGSGKSEIPLS
jgi:hypothetical protein